MKDRTDSGDFYDPYDNEMTRLEKDWEAEIERGEDKMDRKREDELLNKVIGVSLQDAADIIYGKAEDREKLNKAIEQVYEDARNLRR